MGGDVVEIKRDLAETGMVVRDVFEAEQSEAEIDVFVAEWAVVEVKMTEADEKKDVPEAEKTEAEGERDVHEVEKAVAAAGPVDLLQVNS
jgi:hypothetical protein